MWMAELRVCLFGTWVVAVAAAASAQHRSYVQEQAHCDAVH